METLETLETETTLRCYVCGSELTKFEGVPVPTKDNTFRCEECVPGSVSWLKKFGLSETNKFLYHKKGGVRMEDACPEFGTGFVAKARECKACEVVYPKYASECREKTCKVSGVQDVKSNVKKVTKPVSGKPVSVFGHKLGSQAAKVDEYVNKGGTVEQIARDSGTTEVWVKTHLYWLRKKGITITEINGVIQGSK